MADSSSSETVSPQSLITEENVQKTLEADKGKDAVLEGWKVVDFTKKGDNFSCVVTSVEVKYTVSEEPREEYNTSYVVKLNAIKTLIGLPDFTQMMFDKEVRFYQELVPALNDVLVSAGQHPLRFPKCFLVILDDEMQQMYFEDLRASGFRMFDRRKGMDKDHASLVISELARLHSASYLLMDRFSKESAEERFDFLAKEFMDFSSETGLVIKSIYERSIDTGKMMLEKIGGYEKSIDWLERLKPEMGGMFPDCMKSERFKSINHGDCWNNNILFRYDDAGHPVEVMLVDLQTCREASVACDLNYFLFSSVTGEVRKENTDHFMSVYHSSYKAVLEGVSLPIYFEKEELLQEYRDKNKLGLIFSLGLLPVLLMEPDEVIDLTDDNVQKLSQDYRQKSLDKIDTNPLCKPRFLAIFDELMETALIS